MPHGLSLGSMREVLDIDWHIGFFLLFLFGICTLLGLSILIPMARDSSLLSPAENK